jgi:hypothetical protein
MEFDNATNLDRKPGYVGRRRRGDPDCLYAPPAMVACAAFLKESRMEFDNATNLDRKSGRSPTISDQSDFQASPPAGTLMIPEPAPVRF